jgi:hypothetical protein
MLGLTAPAESFANSVHSPSFGCWMFINKTMDLFFIHLDISVVIKRFNSKMLEGLSNKANAI